MKFVPHLKDVIPYAAGTPIEVVMKQYGLQKVVKLASNEAPLPPFPEVMDVITEKFNDLNRYPDAECRDLKAALADRHGAAPEEVIVGNGSCELILWLSLILLEPGTEAVFSDPAFLMYEAVTRARGATAVKVPLNGFANDLDALAQAVTKNTRLLFLTNPHNPTGAYLPYPQIEAFAEGLPGDCVLVLDEAYNEYVEEEDSQAGLDIRRRLENVVVLRTFSKIYGLCGLRVGYGFCDPRVREAVDKVRQPFNVNMLAQAAALKALSLEERLQERRALNREGRRQLYDGLKALGLEYVPTQSNFMLVNVEGLPVPADEVPEELMKRGVIVRPGRPLACPGCIRVSVGTPAENSFLLEKLSELK
ncbi:MAG: histidinol-phosphate transaminase [Thermoleophilia bacterium]|nr:histidinol-phosphate transaminase [Thermoleophilia bacterium]